MSKKLKYIFGAILSLLVLGGCKEEMPSLGEASSVETTSSADTPSAVTTAVPAKEDKETSTVTSEKSENYKMAEKTVLINHIQQAAMEDMPKEDLLKILNGDTITLQKEIYGDFDGDGSEELIAYYNYDWWYTNGRKTYILKEYAGNYTASMFDTGEQKVIILIDYTKTVRYAYLYTFKDGEVTELDASRQFGGMVKNWNNTFEVVAYAHDESFGSGERTEKKYWLYFEDGQFKEFVGEKITKADFMKYSGGKAALDGIETESGTVTEILRRTNGIVNVNYTVDEDSVAHNKYRTYDVSSGDCKETASGDGIYLPSVLNPYSEEQLALHKLILEAAETEGEIVNPLFGDFDGDGINEVIAVLGEHSEDETFQIGGSRGEVWFASGDKAYKLLDHSSMGPWGRPYILKSSGRTLVCIWGTNPGTLGGVDTSTHSFRIKNSEVKEIETDRTVSDTNGEFGDFIGEDITGGDGCVVCYDGEYPHGEGITYKKYWYYYIEDKITGYYGKEISKEEFLKYNGAKDFLDGLAKDGCTLDNILKRGNGIINVNYSSESRDEKREATYIFFNYKTFLYRSGKLTEYDDSYSGGQYEPCLEYDRTEQTDFERFSEMIYDTAEGDENSFIRERFYGDTDKDGKNELYAYYGTDEDFSLWFADDSGAKKVTEDIKLFYADGDVLMKNGDDYFVMKNGRQKKLDTMGVEDFSVQEDGSFTGYVSSGHTDSTRSEEAIKLYWFRYKNGEISEYTGLDITEEEFLQYGGGRAFLDEIAARGGDLVNIVRRENGIININYALHNQTITKRFFMTLEISPDNKLTDITPKNEDGTPDNAGWYLHSLSIASAK